MSALFKRSLAKCGKAITLQNRDIEPPLFGSVDFGEAFSGDVETTAIVKTISGKTFFDGVSVDRLITHELKLEFVADVTAETWVLFKGRRLDILAVENCCETDDILILTCSDLGAGEAAKA